MQTNNIKILVNQCQRHAHDCAGFVKRYLLLNKGWHLLRLSVSNESGTGCGLVWPLFAACVD
jgi:hypothetical protein